MTEYLKKVKLPLDDGSSVEIDFDEDRRKSESRAEGLRKKLDLLVEEIKELSEQQTLLSEALTTAGDAIVKLKQSASAITGTLLDNLTDEENCGLTAYIDGDAVEFSYSDILRARQIAAQSWSGAESIQNKENLRMFPAVDLSERLSLQSFFSDCSSLRAVPAIDAPVATNTNLLFHKASSLTYIPMLNLPATTKATYMLKGCSSLRRIGALIMPALKSIPPSLIKDLPALKRIDKLDLSGITSFSGLFSGCPELTEFGDLTIGSTAPNHKDTFMNLTKPFSIEALRFPKATTAVWVIDYDAFIKRIGLFEAPLSKDASYFAYECKSIEEIDEINIPRVTSCAWMFNNCTSLRRVHKVTAPLLKDSRYMFFGTALEEVPQISLTKCTDTTGTFGRSKISEIPDMNLELSTNMQNFVCENPNLRTVGRLKTPKVERWLWAFCVCNNLERIEEVDFSSARIDLDGSYAMAIFPGSNLRFLFIKNFGLCENTRKGPFDDFSLWGEGSDENRQSLVDTLLTFSADRVAAGFDSCRIDIHQAAAERLTDEEIAAITAKGYTLNITL